MADTTDLIQRATQLLNPADTPARDITKADALARIATAQALHTLAKNADYQPPANKPTPEPWPDGVTARFLTRGGILTNNQNATVDIHDTAHRSTALCRPCGWADDHGIDYRDKVLSAAQSHAGQCTALAQPTS
ncbi:hypothetical protein [Streptomyces olivaceoviridis]|uniref:hypothetical protein n=1 Tax=Streptomyces olivaceoviridis TaxID=1921 RepID=UPI0036CD550F